jgi:hypothetical protein
MKIIMFLFSNFIEWNCFLYKYNGNSSEDFICSVSFLWHAVWHSHKQCVPTVWPRNATYLFLNQLINLISIISFFRTFHLSQSREWITLKTLYLYIYISVNWCYQHNYIIIIIITFLFYGRVNEDTKCFQTFLNATDIRVLLLSFRISSPFSITRTNFPTAKFVSATNLV